MTLSDSRRHRRPDGALRPLPSCRTGLPRYPHHPSDVPCPLPRRIERVHLSIASPSTRPSPKFRRVGIRIFTFEACSGFTRVTARRIAQPPKAAFVTRLRPGQLPDRTARQLPDQSTTIWVEPSSTGDTRHRGARLRPPDRSARADHTVAPRCGLWNPKVCSPAWISGQLMKRRQSRPLRWFSIITMIGPWSIAR